MFVLLNQYNSIFTLDIASNSLKTEPRAVQVSLGKWRDRLISELTVDWLNNRIYLVLTESEEDQKETFHMVSCGLGKTKEAGSKDMQCGLETKRRNLGWAR